MAEDPQTVDGISIRSEQIAFAADELIACPRCAKANPPNRLNCFYCGDPLELPPEIAARIGFKPSEIESWEPGVNIVAIDGLAGADPRSLEGAVAIDPELAEDLARLGTPLPLFRVRAGEADEVERRLVALGISAVRLDDGSLELAKPPTRLKGITFEGERLTFHPFNSKDPWTVGLKEVKLIVVGSLITTASESKLKKKRKETKEFDGYLATSDHAVIDIYSEEDENGFRIIPYGFDFSCLGAAKSLIAAENVKSLLDTLGQTIPDAVVDRSYASKSAMLDRVWPRTVANTSKGIERNWFGVQRAVGATVSNEQQFTRYSRMRRKLI